ncbi:MAG TPA: TOPRIM nucleotidyl transferase/hydrolase domain-containing protein [Actinomycetes bacterium]|nr:TOPRIM nucleotidyl transferase/hydrolase domain-containing protein [Actinomycetes bacterium]
MEIKRFRGFAATTVLPRGHVLVVGEPRAGRSDLIAALVRVLDPDATRASLEEWDFHGHDLTKDLEIEVVLGDLGDDLNQRFLDQLEFWNPEERLMVPDTDSVQQLTTIGAIPVLRLAYRGRWDAEEERGEHWVYYPKTSDPEAGEFRKTARVDRAALPFLAPTPGRPLALTSQGQFRRLLESRGSEQIAHALREMVGVDDLSAKLSAARAVVDGLEAVISPVRQALDGGAGAGEVMRFLPEGGSVTGLLRALQPVADFDDGAGFLPLRRHGSTTVALLALAETMATVDHADAVVVLDDFGDTLDAAGAERLAGLLRTKVAQVWLSTRRPEAARSFAPDEVIRLARSARGRTVHHARAATTRSERLAVRHLHRQLLPAMTARTVAVLEGTHDSAGLTALAERLEGERGVAPPAAFGVRLVDAGGIDEFPRLCELARSLGFRVVAAIDHDNDPDEAARRLAAIESHADGVARLPDRTAIERALIDDVPAAEIIVALRSLEDTLDLDLPQELDVDDERTIREFTVRQVKRNNLHAEFVAALAAGSLPTLGVRLLTVVTELANGSGSGMVEL